MSNENICYGCRQKMPSGVKFCAACGKHNFNAGSTMGPSLANHAKELVENRDANSRMDATWPSFFGRLLIWLLRRH